MFESHVPSFITNLQKRFNADDDIQNEKLNSVINSEIHLHYHPSQVSDSTDSSPTTTVSPLDSSSLSDPSPSPSPKKMLPRSSVTGIKFGVVQYQDTSTDISRLPLSNERRVSSPNQRKKNPKSLALNLSPTTDVFQISEPSSPSFIKPPALKERRKPSILSLNTGAANNLLNEPLASPGISSMLHRRSLKHSVSTPHFLATPGVGPTGGMTLRPPLASSRLRDSSPAIHTLSSFLFDCKGRSESQTGVQMATRVPGATVGGDTFDRPHSGEDAKSPSYPDGPILMHEPNVYLYSEPRRDEAIKFDLIINVAREVKCPFGKDEMQSQGILRPPNSRCSSWSFLPRSASECVTRTPPSFMMNSAEIQEKKPKHLLPVTLNLNTEPRIPEYVHVSWDHSTDVKDELWDLCSLIESRSKQGKRVLVHCQQGASRSATLIIAYGMYINQDLGPNEAYQQAQAKSRWVNPNMSLLFSLNDFKKLIDKKKAEKNIRKPSVMHRAALSTDMKETPLTASRRNSISNVPTRESIGSYAKNLDVPVPASAIEIDSTISRLGAFEFGISRC